VVGGRAWQQQACTVASVHWKVIIIGICKHWPPLQASVASQTVLSDNVAKLATGEIRWAGVNGTRWAGLPT